jgi:hypothetical protein
VADVTARAPRGKSPINTFSRFSAVHSTNAADKPIAAKMQKPVATVTRENNDVSDKMSQSPASMPNGRND